MFRLPLLVALLLVTAVAHARPLYRGGAVSTAHARASEAGLEMLQAGGNAMDAAVAAAFVLAVVGPYHSSLGGGGFLLWHHARKGETRALDFREVAPAAAARDMYLRGGKPVPELSTDGALAVAVPGTPAGLLEAHRQGGKLPRSRVLGPAIRAATQGFRVTPVYRSYAGQRLECLRRDPEASRLFLRPGPDGQAEVPAQGVILRQPELARTLTALAAQGEPAFYGGRVAQALARAVQQQGGILTLTDLQAYRVRWRSPLAGEYRGHRVLTMPPPSAGGVTVLQVLRLLEMLRPGGFAFHDPDAVHLYVEALRRSFLDRAGSLGDPSFVQVPLEELLSQEHIAGWARSIDPARATPTASLPASGGAPTPSAERKHTTHLSVVDAEGNAVALTATHNYYFGACLVAPGTGVLLNDEMDDFASAPLTPNVYSLVTGEANAIAPGKVPLSSMAPTLVFQKERPQQVLLALGAPGGSTIASSVIQVISNVIDAGMELEQAVTAGRLHHQAFPDAIWVEPHGAEPATLRALEAKGHQLRPTSFLGLVHAVKVDPETRLRSAAADPRTEGLAVGQE